MNGLTNGRPTLRDPLDTFGAILRLEVLKPLPACDRAVVRPPPGHFARALSPRPDILRPEVSPVGAQAPWHPIVERIPARVIREPLTQRRGHLVTPELAGANVVLLRHPAELPVRERQGRHPQVVQRLQGAPVRQRRCAAVQRQGAGRVTQPGGPHRRPAWDSGEWKIRRRRSGCGGSGRSRRDQLSLLVHPQLRPPHKHELPLAIPLGNRLPKTGRFLFIICLRRVFKEQAVL
jgi:hypothetical protein